MMVTRAGWSWELSIDAPMGSLLPVLVIPGLRLSSWRIECHFFSVSEQANILLEEGIQKVVAVAA